MYRHRGARLEETCGPFLGLRVRVSLPYVSKRSLNLSDRYRNGQMIYSALSQMPIYAAHLDKIYSMTSIPTIRDFQIILEQAWKEGNTLPDSYLINGMTILTRGLQATTQKALNISTTNLSALSVGSVRWKSIPL
jgi:hypothetical protein